MMVPLPLWRRRAVRFVAAVVAVAGVVAVAAARPGTAAVSDDRVVARVGSRTITVGELEERLAEVPAFQLQVLGDDPDAIRRAFLDQLVEEELLVQAARSEGLDEAEGVQGRIRGLMRAAMLAQVRAEVGHGEGISDEEVARYFEEHQDRYRQERLLKIWQIVVPTRVKALEVLRTIREDRSYQKDPVEGWKRLVAEHSIDLRTKQQHGDLGFVRADGSTKRAQQRVAPAIYQAAAKVQDGQVVGEPVPIAGGAYAVVQRRGTRQTVKRTVETEGPAIRRRLSQIRYEERVGDLLAELRKRHVREKHPERVDDLVVTVPDGEVVPVRRPGGLPRARHRSAASPRPVGRPGHMR